MIITVADFLKEFSDKALVDISESDGDITHRPTIGNIYEGLTSELLQKSVFEGLGLNIIKNSFVTNDSGSLSNEMDCIITTNKGEKIKYTNQYKCHIKDTVAVVQVKKNLYAKDIYESNVNLASINAIASEQTDIDLNNLGSKGDEFDDYIIKLLESSFTGLTGKEARRYTLEHDSIYDWSLYSVLLQDICRPLKFVIGYYGYKNEMSVRKGFVQEIQKSMQLGNSRYFTPWKIPSLYICGDVSIIKNNGMPYGYLIDKSHKNFWNILSTSHGNVMYNFLEILWTRLSFQFNINKSIWENSYSIEESTPLLAGRIKRTYDSYSWEYLLHEFSEKFVARDLVKKKHTALNISTFQYRLLMQLINGPISIKSDYYIKMLDCIKKGSNQNSELSKLIRFNLIYTSEDKIHLRVDDFLATDGPDGYHVTYY